MKKIIVTVTDSKESFCYDIEVPVALTMDKLSDDIVQSLICMNPNIYFEAESVTIYSKFCKKVLAPTDTLESAGVWNGDILVLNYKAI